MTNRLYYKDSYLTQFEAEIEEAASDGRRLYLNRTAFYPTSGGQLHDLGVINGIKVLDVVDEDGRIAHILAEALKPGPVHGEIDWNRRIDFMRQHSGQHLLSAVFSAELGLHTVSVHFGEESSTVDLETPAITPEQLTLIEHRANEIVMENRPLSVAYEDSESAEGLRKASLRQGTLRVVTIDRLDKSACGGTHVRTTGEIGPILLRRLDKIRGNVRVEFLCGPRAVEQARKDYEHLAAVAKQFSCSLAEAAGSVTALLDRAKSQDKTLRTLSGRIAAFEAQALHASTAPNAAGLKVVSSTLATAAGEETRLLVQRFAECGKAAFVVFTENPPTVMLACSTDSGLHAGNLLKSALTNAGGKGGGAATFAQGSLPSLEAIALVRRELTSAGF